MKQLTITCVQTSLIWENSEANLTHFDGLLNKVTSETEVIVLPEMFTTGFTMNAAAVAEKMDGKTVNWMKVKSGELNSAIAGSLIIEEDGKFFNRLVWAQPDGKVFTYDKRHLFRMGDEEKVFTAGKERLIVDYKGWKYCPLVCYDLRFPVWSRNRKDEFDCLLYVANWPGVRSYPWSQLLIARAIENQVYVAGCNRIGNDNKEQYYSGDSAVIDFKGEVISSCRHQEAVFTTVLQKDALDEYRKVFPAWMDADRFEVEM